MKILFVGHDLAYLLFYDAVQKNIPENNQNKFIHLYFRPSANLYAKFSLKKNVICIPSLSGEKSKSNIPKSIESEVVLDFYGKELSVLEKRSLLSKYHFYETELTRKIKEESFDLALIPGEYRLFEQAIIASLKKTQKKCKLLYFESGPPGFIYIDEKGVNANASFKKTKINNLVIQHTSNQKSPNAKTFEYKRSYPFIFYKFFLNIVDVIWLYFPLPNRNISDIFEYRAVLLARLSLFTRKLKNLFQFHLSHASKKKYPCIFAFLGQVENDVNHSLFGVNQSVILNNIDKVMQNSNALLLWRNHPLNDDYDLFIKVRDRFPTRVVLDNSKSLKKILNEISGIITVNSNGGLEGLMHGLPVLLLGKSYYQNIKGVVKTANNFIALATKKRNKILNDSIKNDAARFVRNSFFEVNYRGLDFKNAHLVSKLLICLNDS
jgi:capsular polysaccharide export protein